MAQVAACLMFLGLYIQIQSLDGRIICEQRGFFSSPDSCHAYYECPGHDADPIHRECPAGHFFDDNENTCRPKHLVVSPLQCTPRDEITDGSAYEGPVNDASEGVAPGIVWDSRVAEVHEVVDQKPETKNRHPGSQDAVVTEMTICDNKNAIESYASLVIGSPPFRKSFEYQQEYNKIIDEYNRDLEEARNNISIWRDSSGILNGIERSYQNANEYRKEIQIKLDIYKKRVENLATEDTRQKFIQRLEEDVVNLQEAVKNARLALETAEDPNVQSLFEGIITSNRQEIDRKLQEIESHTKESILLEELATLLEYLKNDAKKIGDLSKQWQSQLVILVRNLEGGVGAFDKHGDSNNEAISVLSEELEKLKVNLTENEYRQEELEKEKESLTNEYNLLMKNNEKINEEIQNLMNVIEKKMDIYNRKVKAICQEGGVIEDMINDNSTDHDIHSACNELLELHQIFLNTSVEEAELERNRNILRDNIKEMTQRQARFESVANELRSLFDKILPLENRMEEINFELRNLEIMTGDLGNLKQSVRGASKSLIKIMQEFELLVETFEPLSSRFQSMIDRTNAAATDDEKRKQKALIEEEIATIQSELEQLELPDLDQCS